MKLGDKKKYKVETLFGLMEYDEEKREIKSGKILNELDELVLDFTKLLEKHVDYIVISGYVSILLGRTRTTEDIDIFIKKIEFEKFLILYKELTDNGFWCINSEKPEEVFSYLKDSLAVRFARGNQSVPNFEVKFPKREVDEEAFQDYVTVILEKGKLRVSSLERHIAFKKYYLGTDRDVEDAEHIEHTFKGQIDYEKVDKLREIIEKIKNEERRNE